MTNYEKIKNMSVEDMAREILGVSKHCLVYETPKKSAVELLINWLNQEAGEK